jgi:hypothetical protein
MILAAHGLCVDGIALCEERDQYFSLFVASAFASFVFGHDFSTGDF